MECNLASFTSIRAFAAELERQDATLDILVLNAAVRGCPKVRAKLARPHRAGYPSRPVLVSNISCGASLPSLQAHGQGFATACPPI